MKRFLSIILILFLTEFGFSQNIDSLKNILDFNGLDENTLVEIIKYYEKISPQNTIAYSDTLLTLSNRSENVENQAFALSKLGKGNFYLGNYSDAFMYWKQSLEKYHEIGQKAGIGEQYNNIGAYYYSIGDYENAMQNYLSSLNIRKEINDTAGIAYALNNIGNIYYAKNQRDLSLQTYLEALKYAELSSDKKILSIVLNNVGSEYAFLEQYDTALQYQFRAVEIKKELNNKMSLAVTYMSIGSIYKYSKDYQNARKFYDMANAVFVQNNSKYYVAKSLNQIAGLFMAQQKFDSALVFLKNSLNISLEINSLSLIENNYFGLSSIFDTLGNSQKALDYLKLYLDVHDSIYDAQSDKRIKDLQIKYETEKKEQENILLKNQIEIDTLQSQRRKNLMYFFIAVSLFLLILALVVFNRYTVKQKLSKLLSEQNTKLLESEANLRDAIYTKDKFFSIIAHDLKSPLSALTLVSEMLNDNLGTINQQKLTHYINSISQTSSGLFDLVNNLLSWARSQSGNITINLQKINVADIVDKLIDLLKTNIEKKNIIIKNNVSDSVFVSADINYLTLVLRNLLINAIKFTDSNGEIIIGVQRIDNETVISVQDSGIGMSKNDQEKLFRIDIDTKSIGNSTEKGTGLGLILCKEFVEKMDGEIWLESELNKGTTFFVKLKKY